MARPTKLTPEIEKKICDYLKEGNYRETAAEMAGIGTTTFYNWLKKGKEAKRKSKFREFRDAVKKAEAFAESYHLQKLRKAGDKGNWQANAWYLERKFPEKWGRKDKLDLKHDGKVKTEHSGKVETLSRLQRIEAQYDYRSDAGGSTGDSADNGDEASDKGGGSDQSPDGAEQ